MYTVKYTFTQVNYAMLRRAVEAAKAADKVEADTTPKRLSNQVSDTRTTKQKKKKCC
jgi:hypothetical protein